MFSKVAMISLIALAAAAPQHQQAARFPAGVDPAACPGFPICDNAQLHNPHANQWNAPAWNAAPNHWNAPAAPAWNAPAAPSWNAAPNHWNAPAAPQWGAPALHGPATNHLGTAGGDKYPAGVNPHTCPNYPFCDNAAAHHGAAPLPGWTERQYPAGVSPHECPNFPYCS